jgi:hypothetical protein
LSTWSIPQAVRWVLLSGEWHACEPGSFTILDGFRFKTPGTELHEAMLVGSVTSMSWPCGPAASAGR